MEEASALTTRRSRVETATARGYPIGPCLGAGRRLPVLRAGNARRSRRGCVTFRSGWRDLPLGLALLREPLEIGQRKSDRFTALEAHEARLEPDRPAKLAWSGQPNPMAFAAAPRALPYAHEVGRRGR